MGRGPGAPRPCFFQPRLPRAVGETTRPSWGGGVTLRTKGGFAASAGAGAAAAARAALDPRSVCALLRALCFAFSPAEGREWSKG